MPTIAQLLNDPISHYPVATVAMFDPTMGELPRRKLDVVRLGRYMQLLAEAGAPAVLIAASTGHGHVRTPDEIAEWFSAAAAAPHSTMMLSALLRPEDGIETNARLAKLLSELGYQVVFVRPGTNLKHDASDRDIAANMQPVVEAIATSGMAAGLYTIPDVSGVRMSPDAAAQVLAGSGGDRVIAIKVTEADYEQSTAKFLADPRLARLKIVQGWDLHLAQALREGGTRCGVTSGPMSFAVHQYLHILAAAKSGDWNEVAAAQESVSIVFRSMQDDPRKFADLQRAKFIMGLGHPLTGKVTNEQTDRVLLAIASISRRSDRERLVESLDLLGDGPFHKKLRSLA